MTDKQEKNEIIRKVLVLSQLDREKFATDILGMTPGTMSVKMSESGYGFSDDHVSKALAYASRNGIWDEYGFKFETDDLSILWRAIIDFTLLPIYQVSEILDIPHPRVYRIRSGKYDRIPKAETKKILALANKHNLRASLKYISTAK